MERDSSSLGGTPRPLSAVAEPLLAHTREGASWTMRFGPILTALRPHQWTKNLLVFAALALTKHLFELEPALRAGLAFAVFCGLSGTVYLLNDVADIERDRLHPLKRLRPVASGALSTRKATSVAVVLGSVCLGLSLVLGAGFAVCAASYLGLNLLYSFRLKEVVILDALSVSLGFVLRAVAGAKAVSVAFSDWLLVCTFLLALFLAFSKRRHELTSLSETASSHRRILAEYSPYLLDQMISVVTASCLVAYVFYTLAAETREKYQTDRLSLTIPFVLYGIFRYLYLVHRKELGGSPSEILLTDKPLLVAVALWALAIVAIVYTASGPPAPFLR
jgi:4-hydroxybenzoate polyprenyltransferase